MAAAIGWVSLATIVESSALSLLRMGSPLQTAGASLIFAVGVVPLLSMAVKYEGIGMVNFFWNILSTIIMFAIGAIFFKEKIAHLQLIGIILSLLGLGLVISAEK